MFDTAAHDKAVQLLRGHLSPEQLTEFDTDRTGTVVNRSALLNQDLMPSFRWFNLTGSLGNPYTISCLMLPHCYEAAVGTGRDNPFSDFCVHVFGQFGGYSRNTYQRLPVADQMLAYKLALEAEEQTFLFRACAINDRASRLRLRHAVAIEWAREEGWQ